MEFQHLARGGVNATLRAILPAPALLSRVQAWLFVHSYHPVLQHQNKFDLLHSRRTRRVVCGKCCRVLMKSQVQDILYTVEHDSLLYHIFEKNIILGRSLNGRAPPLSSYPVKRICKGLQTTMLLFKLLLCRSPRISRSPP